MGNVRETAATCIRQTVHSTVDRRDVEGIAVILAVYNFTVIRAERLVHLYGKRAWCTKALPAECSRQALSSP